MITKIELQILDSLIPFMPSYEGFYVKNKLELLEKSETFILKKELSSDEEMYKKIRNYLLEEGFVVRKYDIGDGSIKYVELTGKGRWLKECGSMKLYLESIEEEKKQKELAKVRAEAIEKSQLELLKNQNIMATTQSEMIAEQRQNQKTMTRLTRWIVAGTLIAGVSALVSAIYYICQLVCHP